MLRESIYVYYPFFYVLDKMRFVGEGEVIFM